MNRAMNIQTTSDPRTGRQIRRLTSWDHCHCGATYFYLQGMTGDERFLIFASDHEREGWWRLYRLELATGEVTAIPLSDAQVEAGLRWHQIHPNGRELILPDPPAVIAMDVESFERRTLIRPPEADAFALRYGVIFAQRGRRLVSFVKMPGGEMGIAAAEGEDARPELVLHWPNHDESFCHLLAPASEDAVCTFCVMPDGQNDPRGSRAARARNFMLDLDTGRAEPFLIMPPGDRATHEYWSTRGRPRLYFHRKRVRTWTPNSIASVDLHGRDYRELYHSDDRQLGHSCMSPDGCWIVSDVQDPAGNELLLIDVASGAAEVLCWPDASSVVNETGHVHPFFSPSGRHVIYTSDHGGKAAVYMVPDVCSPADTGEQVPEPSPRRKLAPALARLRADAGAERSG